MPVHVGAMPEALPTVLPLNLVHHWGEFACTPVPGLAARALVAWLTARRRRPRPSCGRRLHPPLGACNIDAVATVRRKNAAKHKTAGRGGAWRREDMERARLRANTAERRRNEAADECWLARGPIGEDLRAAFGATVAREELVALAERGLPAGQALPTLLRRAVSRDAIRRALVAHDMLHFKRRLHPQPIKNTIADKCG